MALLDDTVGAKIKFVIRQTPSDLLSKEGDAIWSAVRYLIPEVIDRTVRVELEQIKTLPDWAKPSTAP